MTTEEQHQVSEELAQSVDSRAGLEELQRDVQEHGQAALDEVSREARVRERCFPRWVTEGRITATDAKDRLERLQKAENMLKKLLDTLGSGKLPF